MNRNVLRRYRGKPVRIRNFALQDDKQSPAFQTNIDSRNSDRHKYFQKSYLLRGNRADLGEPGLEETENKLTLRLNEHSIGLRRWCGDPGRITGVRHQELPTLNPGINTRLLESIIMGSTGSNRQSQTTIFQALPYSLLFVQDLGTNLPGG
jgi:hypothetical protein